VSSLIEVLMPKGVVIVPAEPGDGSEVFFPYSAHPARKGNGSEGSIVKVCAIDQWSKVLLNM